MAQAKTGTGKTLAFLVPVLQNILRDSSLQKRRGGGLQAHASDIRAIIVSPTRELAEQIAVEAVKVASSTGVVVQTAVGGTKKKEGLLRIQQQGCHLLVGTPGRLKDILSDPNSGVSAPRLSALVLDEADRLLDQGFAPDIEELQRYLPDPMKVDRQTLMFSATVPAEVMGMVRRTMKPDFKFIKTIQEDEVPTHLTVPQKAVFLRGLENALPAVLELVKNYKRQAQQDSSLRPFKAIVYLNSTADVEFWYEAFRALCLDPTEYSSPHPLEDTEIYQIHSKLTQSRRKRSSQSFRWARSAILFSSDVTARGMDFPEVTHVIQIGAPLTREAYIHRLGRTARANKKGEGWVLLHDLEYDHFSSKTHDLPISKDMTSLQTATVNMAGENKELPAPVAEIFSQLKAAMKRVPYDFKAESYKGQISVLRQTFDSKRDIIRTLNNLAINGWGLSRPPAVDPNWAKRRGIHNIEGLNVLPPKWMKKIRERRRYNSDDFTRRHRFNDRNDNNDRQQFDGTGRYGFNLDGNYESDRNARSEHH